MDQELEYFHLHKSVSQDQLIKELNQYDFGLIPFFHRTNKRLNDKRYYSTTLKFYNFMEAGVPVLIGSDTLFQNYMGRQYGGGISLNYKDVDNLKKLLAKQSYNSLLDNIKVRREELSLKRKINSVIEFYQK
jgi:hypothetical protein